MRDQHGVNSQEPGGAAERLERAATLLLATSALAGVALVGWGGLIIDLRPLGTIGGLLWHAVTGGEAIWPALGGTVAWTSWEALAPVVGTVISVLFWWHAVSLAAELLLLLATSLGWLWNRSLLPLWLILDLLDSAPLAAPKRLVVATALAGQMLVRSSIPTAAAPMPAAVALVVDERPIQRPAPTTAGQVRVAQPAPKPLLHRVQRGDTASRIAARYYGHAGYWPILVKANLGAIMAMPAHGLGHPIRFTNPDYLLPGWDMVIPPLPGHLELGDGGELVYVVQKGDTSSEIAERFGVDLAELVAANIGAQTPDGHVFEDPDLIWPQLRLRIRPLEPVAPTESTPAEATPASEPAAPEPATPEATEPAAPAVATPSPTVEPSPVPTATPVPVNGYVAPSRGDKPVVVPTAPGPPAETPARPGPHEPPIGEWPLLLAAGGLSAATLLALRTRRNRSPAAAPESDTQVDVHAFTLAEPARVMVARREGGDDPHGIVLGEQVAGALLGHVRAAGLSELRVVSVRVGRTGCVVTFEAPLDQRPRLEATLRTALHLARRLTVSRSADQDVIAQLEGIQRHALERGRLEDCPLLLCVGLQPDTYAYLLGWEALGHVLVATEPGTSDAHEHLAGLVATLAGQCPPTELHLYTLAPPDTLLGRLGPLPHQRAMVDPADRPAAAQLLANLRAEVERRQEQAPDASLPELVLVISELAHVAAEEDLAYVLAHGRVCRARIVAATADTGIERGPLVDTFDGRVVLALDDEEASARLLGKPWALTLAEPGRLLVRLGPRKEVEILGLHLTEDGRRDLLASMGVSEASPSVDSVSGERDASASPVPVEPTEPQDGPAPPEPDDSQPGTDSLVQLVQAALDEEVQAAPEASSVEPAEAAGQPPGGTLPGANGHVVDVPAPVSRQQQRSALPARIATLLERARFVIDCEKAAVWSAEGQLRLEQSSPIEVLFRLAAAPLLVQGPLDRWPGVKTDELLEEVWAPRARDPRNRDSAQTWLAKNLTRLQEEVSRAAGGCESEVLVKGAGTVRINTNVAVSDVEAFMAAVERARAARGAEQVAAAEEALALGVPELLLGAYVERSVPGRKIELYRWLAEPQWERASSRLAALGREVTGLLARAYCDAGRHEEALALYAQLLGDDPLDRRTREGLLIASAGTGDRAQVDQAWQQICVCLGGEADQETRALYDGLVQQMQLAGTGTSPAAVAGRVSRSGRSEDDARGA